MRAGPSGRRHRHLTACAGSPRAPRRRRRVRADVVPRAARTIGPHRVACAMRLHRRQRRVVDELWVVAKRRPSWRRCRIFGAVIRRWAGCGDDRLHLVSAGGDRQRAGRAGRIDGDFAHARSVARSRFPGADQHRLLGRQRADGDRQFARSPADRGASPQGASLRRRI